MTPTGELLLDLFERIGDSVRGTASELDVVTLNRRPAPGSNSIGWLLWHLTRSHDRNISEIAGVEQVWLQSKWWEVFGRAADGRDTGYGHSSFEAAGFWCPSAEAVVGYHAQVLDMIRVYVSGVDDLELARVSTSATLNESRVVALRIGDVLAEGFQHAGQAAYLAGMFSRGAHGPGAERSADH
jgi:hypothetical protein